MVGTVAVATLPPGGAKMEAQKIVTFIISILSARHFITGRHSCSPCSHVRQLVNNTL